MCKVCELRSRGEKEQFVVFKNAEGEWRAKETNPKFLELRKKLKFPFQGYIPGVRPEDSGHTVALALESDLLMGGWQRGGFTVTVEA